MEAQNEGPLTYDDKILLSIVRVAELLKREQGMVFKKYGLTFTQYNILCTVLRCDGGQTNTTSVSKNMLVSGPNISATCKKLENEKFLERKRHQDDERVILLKILPKGRETIKQIQDEKNENLNKLFECLNVKEKAIILNSLTMVLENN